MKKPIQFLKLNLSMPVLSITLLTILPALLFVCVNASWDTVLFLVVYSTLSIWVVQVLNAEHQGH
ncbi:hypothetical protein [Providencia alcalifaciens]|uniref:Uncharacterized protein n=1 Tax=Providencia alcalifaciens 205/92 TaxID=1256988 RepID=A0AAV3M6X3_9GAMM|nr:hypothetical protein [Providencia alcalifaciens]EUD04115.1 hypothetical protein HMPREF1565_0632 [Providencia alcalifaciens RIMD 1656011]EUD11682.1 hypothetical protein HMPREF1563_0331 [Providencia alcalifaciens 205/92]MTC25732.1 hypothetical protein [Providencia alcalifaciens]MTC62422.1 hypothetical protein [Providencia alcalifaciens]WGZ56296.1 hypothetical protein PO864_20060 [Providencia alcalifaciens]